MADRAATSRPASASIGVKQLAEVVVVRHGETSWNASHIIQGQMDPELNEIGRSQARVVARRLSREAKPAAVYSSDLRRASETAQIIATVCGVSNLVFDPALRERHMGDLQGLVFDDAVTRNPEIFSWNGRNQEIPDTMQQNIEDELKELKNKARFISCLISGEIKIVMRDLEELLQAIIAKGFDRLPKEGQVISMDIDMVSNPDVVDYAYLISMRVRCISKEYLCTLAEQTKKIEAELARKDTKSLRHGACKKAESDREVMVDTRSKDNKKLRAHKGINKRAKGISNTGVLTAHIKTAKQSKLIGAQWQYRKL